MELFNATGETLSHKYDNVPYFFPPSEIVRVTDDCGKHMILKIGSRGLQEIRFGDDPEKLGLVAIQAIVAFHRDQIEVHETQVRVASESKNPVPAEPEGYKIAKRRLPTYEKVMEERKADAEVAATKAEEAAIREALDKPTGEIKALEDLDVDEARGVIRSFGEEPDMRVGLKKLIATIEELRKEQTAEADED